MAGYLDELDQAFLTIDTGQGALDFQIDTGFSGALVVGHELFDASRATPSGTIEAALARVTRRATDSQRPVFPPIGEIARKLFGGFDVER